MQSEDLLFGLWDGVDNFDDGIYNSLLEIVSPLVTQGITVEAESGCWVGWLCQGSGLTYHSAKCVHAICE